MGAHGDGVCRNPVEKGNPSKIIRISASQDIGTGLGSGGREMKAKRYLVLSLLAIGMLQVVPLLAADLSAYLPPTRTQGAITYTTGGVGQPESTAMKAAAGRYDLALMFANSKGEFLNDIKVYILDNRGDRVLEIWSGPILLANLPNGTYRIYADMDGSPRVKDVTVSGRRHRQMVYTWPVGVDRVEFAGFEIQPTQPR
jgi:hypothetical protein